MKVTGFTIIRNAIKYDYPVVESIKSILPICDEFVVAVGESEDETRELVSNISANKIKIIDTKWDMSLRTGGRVLAEETNKALNSLSEDTDWGFYIQADEVMHEQWLPHLMKAMEHYKDDPITEGLLVNYLHFYGSYDYIGDSRRWYRKEIRIVKPKAGLSSYRDAQGFRINDRKLVVKQTNAFMHHYGWVKPPDKQQEKQKNFHKLWHDDSWLEKNVGSTNLFDYSNIDSLSHFTGSHPKEMIDRINRVNWSFEFDPTKKNFGMKAALLHFIEKQTGWRPGEYKNYILK
jgi:glycosyltransferase involved in cell wall biosynthesis